MFGIKILIFKRISGGNGHEPSKTKTWNVTHQFNSQIISTSEEDIDTYFCFSLSCSESGTSEDGVRYYTVRYGDNTGISEDYKFDSEGWEFRDDNLQTEILRIGFGNFGNYMELHVSKMKLKCLRVYARGLSRDELLANYQTSVAIGKLIN